MSFKAKYYIINIYTCATLMILCVFVMCFCCLYPSSSLQCHVFPSLSECKILSAVATGPSSILVKWEKYPRATNYFLDLRVKNSTRNAPVVVTLSGTSTEKDVYGLLPGTDYKVTLKPFVFYFAMCVSTYEASTGK